MDREKAIHNDSEAKATSIAELHENWTRTLAGGICGLNEAVRALGYRKKKKLGAETEIQCEVQNKEKGQRYGA